MDRILELLARFADLTDEERTELAALLDPESESYGLADATDEQVAEVEQTLVDLFAEADGDDPDLDAMETFAAYIEVVRAEGVAREAQAAEDDERAASLRDRVTPAADDTGDGDGDDEGEGDDEGAGDEPDADAVAAAATRRAARNRRTRREPREQEHQSATAIVAAAETGFEAGATISREQLGEAMGHRIDALLAAGGKGAAGRYSAGRVLLDYPDEFTLTRGDALLNRQRIDAVTAPQAVVAAGGICRTPDVDYDLPGVESAARPIRDALARFGANRGGVRVMPTPTLADASDAVGVWTQANDADPNNAGDTGVPVGDRLATKPLLTIDCGEEETVFVHAVTARAQIGNFNRQFFPELWDRYETLIAATHARVAEDRLFDAMVADATAVTHAETLGASRDFLTGLDRAVAAFRYRHRVAEGIRIDWFVPFYVRNLIRMDLTRQLPGDDVMNVTDEQIDAMIRSRGVNPVYSLDGGSNNSIGAQGAGALLDLPSDIETVFAPAGNYVFLDGGMIDLGAEITDSTLVGTNDVQSFMETFEGVYRNGVEALAVTFSVCPSGSSVGTTTAVTCGS